MAGHGNRGLYLPENMLVECEEKHAVAAILNASIKTFMKYYQKENCLQFNPSEKTCSAC